MNHIIKLLMVLTLLLCAGCASYCRIDGPYKGKIVDAETRQPLEGVVVLGVWYKVQLTVAGPTGSFYDSTEVLTDKNGEFNIPGQGLLLFSNVDEIDAVIFKAGYEMLETPWSGFKTRTGGKNVQWDGDNPTFLLRKLSYEERKKRSLGVRGVSDDKAVKLINEIHKEDREIGKE